MNYQHKKGVLCDDPVLWAAVDQQKKGCPAPSHVQWTSGSLDSQPIDGVDQHLNGSIDGAINRWLLASLESFSAFDGSTFTNWQSPSPSVQRQFTVHCVKPVLGHGYTTWSCVVARPTLSRVDSNAKPKGHQRETSVLPPSSFSGSLMSRDKRNPTGHQAREPPKRGALGE